MPTGYTVFIENGDISTGAEFLKKCIRNFGCCIGQRDDALTDPLITDIKPDTYYKRQYDYYLGKLETFRKKSIEEIKEELCAKGEKKMNEKKKYLSDQLMLRNKYLAIRNDVERWVPPTPDHQGIKDFALEQIDMCIPTNEYLDKLEKQIQSLENQNTDVTDEMASDYIIDELNFYGKRLKYYSKRMNEEEERAANRTKFIKDFLSSLN